MFENRIRIGLIVGIILSVVATLGAYWYFRPDPQLAKVEEMREQMRSEETRNLSREQRRELFGQFRKEVEKLSIEQRRRLFAERRNPLQERLDKFFKASRQEQVTMIDQTIQREEQFRANMANANPQRGFGNPGNSTPEDREKRRQQWLSMTTPLERAQMAEFRQQVQQRRQQLGLGASPWGGRGGHG
jgi:FtsZ-interacting cell division protein ZipA